MRKQIIGYVGVDSGQLLICDPCYVESEWIREPYDMARPVEVQWRGVTHYIDMAKELEAGRRYDSRFAEFGGKTMSELLRLGKARELPLAETRRFSYDGCCKATNQPAQGGQLNYKMGHVGAGVAARTGYGDGFYPVYAHYNEERRIIKIEVILVGGHQE